MTTDNSKTPLKDKLSILVSYCVLIGMAFTAINYLFGKAIFQYQNGMFSFVPLLPYHMHCKVALIIIISAILAFYGWIAHNFFSGKHDHDSYTVMVILTVSIFLMCWGGTLYALSAPIPIMGLIALLVILLPFSIFVTVVIFRVIKMTILGD